jgi:hypothetical protein
MNKENTQRKECARQKNKQDSYYRISNIISGIVAFATLGTLITYVIVSISQNDKTRESLKLTQRSLELTEQSIKIAESALETDRRNFEIRKKETRPDISIDIVEFGGIAVNNIPFLKYKIINHGSAASSVNEYHRFGFSLITHPIPTIPINIDTIKGGYYLGKEQPFNMSTTINGVRMKNQDWEWWTNKITYVYFFAIVYFKDIMGNWHWSQACYIAKYGDSTMTGLREYFRTDQDKKKQTNK